jgi:outer membrane protein TolC/membrane protein DedA with SNARE-associated domain
MLVINQVLQFLSHHGVAFLFVSVLAGQAGLPVPDVPVLLAAGSLASLGRGSLVESVAVAIIACLIADVFWYQIGQHRQVQFFKCAERSPLSKNHLRCAMGAFERHGGGVLLLSKFVPGPSLVPSLAGISGMTRTRFLLLDGFAAAIWAGVYIAAGSIFSKPLQRFTAYGPKAGLALLVVLACVCVMVGMVRSARHHWPQKRRLAAVLASVLLLFVAVGASAQATQGGSSATSSFISGSVPSGLATNEELHLTLRDSINMALRYNLGAVESGENSRSARGQRLLALSHLLPQVRASAQENVNQTSMATLGLKLPSIPNVIGPYSYTTAGLSASQTLFSLEAIQRLRAARTAEQAAQLDYKDTLDVVTLTVGNAYLQVLQAASRIEVQEAQVRNAKALNDQAVAGYEAGTRPRIDATRTEVQLRTEQYTLIVDRNDLAIAKLTLARTIGLPLGQNFEATDTLPYAAINPPTLDDALKTAYVSRSDYAAAINSEKAAERNLSATKSERLPVLSTSGNYADTGTTLGHSHGTFGFQAGVSIPLFTGGRIKGEITQADATLRQRKAESENIRGQIDYDVRAAFLNLGAAKEQLEVAEHNVALANENLARSKDRFTAGVADSVEVVQAEQSLASANDQAITSAYNHNLAKLALARALGVARTSYDQYLGGK